MAKRKKRRRKGLAAFAEEFAISLLFEASGGKIGRGKPKTKEEAESSVSFRDRRALLDSMTKLLGAQDAPEDDDEDGVEFFRERLNERSGEDSERADPDADDEASVRDRGDKDGSSDDEI